MSITRYAITAIKKSKALRELAFDNTPTDTYKTHEEAQKWLDDLIASNSTEHIECTIGISLKVQPVKCYNDGTAISEIQPEASYCRKCSQCGNGMNSGYIVGGGEAYYCSDECLHKNYTPDQWKEMTKEPTNEDTTNTSDENYWTEWDEKSDIEYEQHGGKLIEL